MDKFNDQKIAFLYKTIEDAQSINRMTDAKAAAIIAFWTAGHEHAQDP